ncbi:CPBP family intramembrane glutamic endopeptidase [Gephyromycinifex aptenodytis]|uniref:CPBP family intramembrane glutamic endopeptidase n=1 Tax=Gephyromycinifex aptenodytis TaxID=2716227 RepID=UPI001448A24B|nr:CPBP family intramembrane glutamic endopeptidase [Gephyromycinifex aptenodytis]
MKTRDTQASRAWRTRPVPGAQYQQVLRTPAHRWWKPLLSIFMVCLGIFVVLLLSMPVIALVAWAAGTPDPWATASSWLEEDSITAMGFLVLDIWLASLAVVALVAVRVGHWMPARWMHSVAGRVRWAWLGRCLLVLVPVWILYVGISWWIDGADPGTRAADWYWFALLALFVTPLQAAGEEYLFRGWLLTSLGSWFSNRWLALIIPALISTALFAAAHGSADPWILLDLGAMATACVILIWRTGGLEAAVALHVANNVVIGMLGALTGATADSLIDTDSTGDPLSAGVSVFMSALAVILVLHQARRAGISCVVGAPATDTDSATTV